MKSRQFTLGLVALILTLLISFKTLAQCCIALTTSDLTATIYTSGPPLNFQYAQLQWQRVQKAGCTTPLKYKVEYRVVGHSVWTTIVVTIKNPDAKFGDTLIGAERCTKKSGFPCSYPYEWRVRGICSDTNKTAFVRGQNFNLKGLPPNAPFTTSPARAVYSEGNFTVAAYPNPVTSELKLSGNLKAGGPVNMQIINSVGQTVLRQDYNFNPGNFSAGIDVSKLSPGVYLVVVNDRTERATLSIVKQ